MLRKSLTFAIVFLTLCIEFASLEKCESAIATIYDQSSSVVWDKQTSLSSLGCDVAKNISIVVHGWNDGRLWIKPMITNLLKARGGYVIFFDYDSCVDSSYVKSLGKWKSVSIALTSMLQEMENQGVSPDNLFAYGFSLGARITIDACINFGIQKVASVDVCDMANIGFDFVYENDPKNAAKNIQCIFTSQYAGSIYRDLCHQNWLMGNCGKSQPAADDNSYLACLVTDCKGKTPVGSHPLCNIFYLSAFENSFTSNNALSCEKSKVPEDLPNDFQMGFMENRKQYQGVFASKTFAKYPYNGSA